MTQELIMNAIKLTALATLMAVGVSAQAADIVTIPDVTVTGSVAVTTDYLFRGVSQSSNNAAIQGSMTATHASGVYGTIWGSSIANAAGGSEIDVLLGYATPINLTPTLKGTLDVGIMRYIYSGANDKNPTPSSGVDPDYNELYASVALPSLVMKDDTVKVGLAYSNDYYNETDQFFYVYSSYAAPLAGTNFGIVTNLGLNQFDSSKMMRQALGTTQTKDDNYIDYKLGTTFTVQGINTEFAYAGTDIDDKDCGGNLCDGRFVLTLSKAF
jgi:uncharacterized protein (TIGR02001 family)